MEEYKKYININETVDVRTKKIKQITQEGEVKKTRIQSEEAVNENDIKQDSDKSTDIASKLLFSFSILGFFIFIVICTSKGGFWGFVNSFVIGIIAFPIIGGIINAICDAVIYNKQKKRMDPLKAIAEKSVEDVDKETKERIRAEIESYDKNVKETFDKVISDPSNIDTMVDYSIEMFKRMISHADSDSNKRFIECNFTYVVTLNEIKYLYDSEYTNPRDDFNFEKQRYRNLHCDYEREGLALALAQIVSKSMKDLYPPNTINITIKNVDYKVTMAFKAPNEKFVVARDIV